MAGRLLTRRQADSRQAGMHREVQGPLQDPRFTWPEEAPETLWHSGATITGWLLSTKSCVVGALRQIPATRNRHSDGHAPDVRLAIAAWTTRSRT